MSKMAATTKPGVATLRSLSVYSVASSCAPEASKSPSSWRWTNFCMLARRASEREEEDSSKSYAEMLPISGSQVAVAQASVMAGGGGGGGGGRGRGARAPVETPGPPRWLLGDRFSAYQAPISFSNNFTK